MTLASSNSPEFFTRVLLQMLKWKATETEPLHPVIMKLIRDLYKLNKNLSEVKHLSRFNITPYRLVDEINTRKLTTEFLVYIKRRFPKEINTRKLITEFVIFLEGAKKYTICY